MEHQEAEELMDLVDGLRDGLLELTQVKYQMLLEHLMLMIVMEHILFNITDK